MPFHWKIRRIFKDKEENVLGYGHPRQCPAEQAKRMIKVNPGLYEVLDREVEVPEDPRHRKFTGKGAMEPVGSFGDLKKAKPKLSSDGKGF